MLRPPAALARAVLQGPDITAMLNEISLEVESERTVFAAFAHRFRALRARLFLKQVTLSFHVRCTEAAISYWESGHRLPKRTTIERIIARSVRAARRSPSSTISREPGNERRCVARWDPHSDHEPLPYSRTVGLVDRSLSQVGCIATVN